MAFQRVWKIGPSPTSGIPSSETEASIIKLSFRIGKINKRTLIPFKIQRPRVPKRQLPKIFSSLKRVADSSLLRVGLECGHQTSNMTALLFNSHSATEKLIKAPSFPSSTSVQGFQQGNRLKLSVVEKKSVPNLSLINFRQR
jgi:hypothetical protein